MCLGKKNYQSTHSGHWLLIFWSLVADIYIFLIRRYLSTILHKLSNKFSHGSVRSKYNINLISTCSIILDLSAQCYFWDPWPKANGFTAMPPISVSSWLFHRFVIGEHIHAFKSLLVLSF